MKWNLDFLPFRKLFIVKEMLNMIYFGNICLCFIDL